MLKELKEPLKNRFRGRLIQPGDEAYNKARKVYNGMIDKYPKFIVECASVQDVMACVNFARENNLPLAIRGGGHNGAGLAVCDDGLVIDLSRMKNIHVDAVAKTVCVEGGCTLAELDRATHQFGLAVPTGIIGNTGIGGLALGGGVGYLARKHGLSIDNLLEADIVLANGSLVKASATSHADLFWAIRGGGGNFGVVTSFLFRAHAVNIVYGGPMIWEMDDAKEIMQWYRDFIKMADDDLNGFFAFLSVPPGPPFPEPYHLRKMCGIVWCYTGNEENANKIFSVVRKFKRPAIDFVGPIAFPALQTLFDPLYPAGMQWYWKGDFVNELTDKAIDLHIQHAKQMPTWLSTMHLYPVNGAVSRVKDGDTAWAHRGATWAKVIAGIDADPINKNKIINWAKEYWSALHPHTAGGSYINFMMEEGEERIKATYGSNYAKLVEVKTKYDPQNLFRINQNIKPRTSGL